MPLAPEQPAQTVARGESEGSELSLPSGYLHFLIFFAYKVLQITYVIC